MQRAALAGGPNRIEEHHTEKDSASLLDLQAEHLSKMYAVSTAAAVVVAELLYGVAR